MAAAINSVKTSATSAWRVLSTHGGSLYKRVLEKNAEYVVHEPTVEVCQDLAKRLFYTRLASIPNRYNALQKEVEVVRSKWANRAELSVEEVAVAALFAGECYAWFCVGEIVGRGGTLTGYKV
ncbi:hypothetical protein CBR_g39189 [Chara braunii]|uniref:ATP synthase subunit n=1 Tax=Chara braunii TaxID=69332 RepID=A0A388LRG8_CHABU|nr:hypothetical protein CBR_g39189 [Chara braunii]|eukprot:GBG84813.1 hypothetical protein CBR_g39189 [Chara braunii]